MIVVVAAFLALCVWQVHRAQSGNTLSYAYAFEWPIFAGYVVFMWWQLLQDELHPDRVRHRLALGRPQGELPPGWALKEPRRSLASRSLVAVGAYNIATSTPESPIGAPGEYPPAMGGDGPGFSSDPVDEEMAAYNRYLAELNAHNERKHW